MRKDRGLWAAQSGWMNSMYVCALSDGARHLGHITLNFAFWDAWDATHLNDERNGFKLLGAFKEQAAAKAAVEKAVSYESKRYTLVA
jgi:hypothetical protein